MLNTILIIICVLTLFAMIGLDIFISQDSKNSEKSIDVEADNDNND